MDRIGRTVYIIRDDAVIEGVITNATLQVIGNYRYAITCTDGTTEERGDGSLWWTQEQAERFLPIDELY
ncbi:hypothetical protein [Nocardioides soli]|uniref:Uncharacterized protein n=1 Tax=Nocardioides soli TaxID=1036020 RepID=A0A7W4YZK3_9ACTN|nr:hypothetical protein [Nocardioides soli]MBB3041042.1 hypothetical protein [Nocardioides soli]